MTLVDVRPAASRFHTELGWLDSWHSFSFGPHYDAANTHHGLLLVSNDDRVRPARGFGSHSHRDMEIVTWVLSGTLEHRDSAGNHGVLYPGLAQRMSAGTGISHSEMNPSPTDDVHFVQMWVVPDTNGLQPGYEQRDINEALDRGGLHPIASGQDHDGAVVVHQRDAVLWGGRLQPGERVAVPEAAHVHVFIARGGATLDGATLDGAALDQGDAARVTDSAALSLTAEPGGAEVLIWATA
ncbi:MAG TPA: pirin family protein [Acidimicrobiales bacterium]|nr:pirin family protein [Acidimicrobiales bacterium]